MPFPYSYPNVTLDGYIAGDCPLCGFVMLDSLAQSLIDEEASAEAQSWII
jgi:hypothetical protein